MRIYAPNVHAGGRAAGSRLLQWSLGEDWYRHEHPDAKIKIADGFEPEPALRWNVLIAVWKADDALFDAVNAAIERVIERRIPKSSTTMTSADTSAIGTAYRQASRTTALNPIALRGSARRAPMTTHHFGDGSP